jgi:hypothetical protein
VLDFKSAAELRMLGSDLTLRDLQLWLGGAGVGISFPTALLVP